MKIKVGFLLLLLILLVGCTQNNGITILLSEGDEFGGVQYMEGSAMSKVFDLKQRAELTFDIENLSSTEFEIIVIFESQYEYFENGEINTVLTIPVTGNLKTSELLTLEAGSYMIIVDFTSRGSYDPTTDDVEKIAELRLVVSYE